MRLCLPPWPVLIFKWIDGEEYLLMPVDPRPPNPMSLGPFPKALPPLLLPPPPLPLTKICANSRFAIAGQWELLLLSKQRRPLLERLFHWLRQEGVTHGKKYMN